MQVMRWFGTSPWAPICDDCPKVETPVGRACGWCDEPIQAGDDGVMIPHGFSGFDHRPYHYECNLRQTVGGINHLQGGCTCCGGKLPPDPEHMSKRQAALTAVRYWELIRQQYQTRALK